MIANIQTFNGEQRLQLLMAHFKMLITVSPYLEKETLEVDENCLGKLRGKMYELLFATSTPETWQKPLVVDDALKLQTELREAFGMDEFNMWEKMFPEPTLKNPHRPSLPPLANGTFVENFLRILIRQNTTDEDVLRMWIIVLVGVYFPTIVLQNDAGFNSVVFRHSSLSTKHLLYRVLKLSDNHTSLLGTALFRAMDTEINGFETKKRIIEGIKRVVYCGEHAVGFDPDDPPEVLTKGFAPACVRLDDMPRGSDQVRFYQGDVALGCIKSKEMWNTWKEYDEIKLLEEVGREKRLHVGAIARQSRIWDRFMAFFSAASTPAEKPYVPNVFSMPTCGAKKELDELLSGINSRPQARVGVGKTIFQAFDALGAGLLTVLHKYTGYNSWDFITEVPFNIPLIINKFQAHYDDQGLTENVFHFYRQPPKTPEEVQCDEGNPWDFLLTTERNPANMRSYLTFVRMERTHMLSVNHKIITGETPDSFVDAIINMKEFAKLFIMVCYCYEGIDESKIPSPNILESLATGVQNKATCRWSELSPVRLFNTEIMEAISKMRECDELPLSGRAARSSLELDDVVARLKLYAKLAMITGIIYAQIVMPTQTLTDEHMLQAAMIVSQMKKLDTLEDLQQFGLNLNSDGLRELVCHELFDPQAVIFREIPYDLIINLNSKMTDKKQLERYNKVHQFVAPLHKALRS
jgi:hypothetical protein